MSKANHILSAGSAIRSHLFNASSLISVTWVICLVPLLLLPAVQAKALAAATEPEKAIESKYFHGDKCSILSAYFLLQTFGLPLELSDVVEALESKKSDSSPTGISNFLERCGFEVQAGKDSLDALLKRNEMALFVLIRRSAQSEGHIHTSVILPSMTVPECVFDPAKLSVVSPEQAGVESGEIYEFLRVTLPEEKTVLNVQVSPEAADLGVVLTRNTYSAIFTVTNGSGIPIRLGPVKTSCSCTKHQIGREMLYPGEQSEVQLDISTRDDIGDIGIKSTLSAFGVGEISLPMNTNAQVREILTFFPEALIIGDFSKRERKEVSLEYSIDPYFGYDLTEIEKLAKLSSSVLTYGNPEWELDNERSNGGKVKLLLTLPSDAPVGPFKDSISVMLEGKLVSTIPVSGTVVGELVLDRRFIQLSSDGIGGYSGTIQVNVNSESPRTPAIKCDDKNLQIDVVGSAPGIFDVKISASEAVGKKKLSRATIAISLAELGETSNVEVLYER